VSAPAIRFFDTCPSGRIINRFSRDTETIDIILPGIIVQFLGCIASITTTLAIICAATGWFTAGADTRSLFSST
jgi:ATP-binding cassette subfamily C (CFTR/MRP) protein 1